MNSNQSNAGVLLRLILIELKEYFRNVQAAFWTFLYPMAIVFFLMLAFGGGTVDGGIGGLSYGSYLICGMLAVNIMSMGFFGFGIPFMEARNRGAFKMYHVFPVWKFSYISSFVLSRVLVVVLFSLVFVAANNLIYGLGLDLTVHKMFKLSVVVGFSALAFISMTFLLVSFMSKTATATAVLNIVFYPMMIFSDLFIPEESMMEQLAWINQVSPLSLTAVSFREIVINDVTLASQFNLFMTLAAIAIVCMLISLKSFQYRR
ncbi:ABC transporter permease [Alteromonas sp. V450]|uniref:ABC transporter permease n=1 Tax=Alteromonas sp. V450 TaxID=1912139 RepID=UPI0015A719C6|nr:ABC transporter permease [Alteromonas sp. V450]